MLEQFYEDGREFPPQQLLWYLWVC
jgi:hypothetical protein